MMQDGIDQKAFRYAWTTVGIATVAVAAMFFYRAGPHSENWPMYGTAIAVSALLVFPLVYFSYKKGLRPVPQQQSFTRAALFGLCTCIWTILFILNHQGGWKALPKWFSAGACLMAMLKYLHDAYKKAGSLSLTQ